MTLKLLAAALAINVLKYPPRWRWIKAFRPIRPSPDFRSNQ